MKMEPEDIRKAFELAVIFGIPGLPVAPGCLERNRDSRYYMNDVQAAYIGYARAMNTQNNMLERLSPHREVTNGMRTRFRELIGMTGEHELSDQAADQMMRAAIQVFAGSPV